MNDPLRIVFMGTPDFAATALQSLIDAGHAVIAAYSQPPRPKGRGKAVQKSAVHTLADAHNIPIFTPENFKDDDAIEEFRNLKADIAIVAAYGLILPQMVLDIPVYGCLNIHASLLPRWRGAAPIQHAIWKGDDKTGITIMKMDAGLDTGPMILKEELAITTETTASTLHDNLADMGGALILKTLDILKKDGVLEYDIQPDEGMTYASMLRKEDGKIDWTQNAADIDRQVRALTPWPGTFCMNGDQRLKIHTVRLSDQMSNAVPGTIINSKGFVACGHNTTIQMVDVQPENKKSMDASAAFNGGYIKEGQALS